MDESIIVFSPSPAIFDPHRFENGCSICHEVTNLYYQCLVKTPIDSPSASYYIELCKKCHDVAGKFKKQNELEVSYFSTANLEEIKSIVLPPIIKEPEE